MRTRGAREGRPAAMIADTRTRSPATHTGAVFDAATDGMLVIGALPGRRYYSIVDVNRELCAMTGFSHDELIGLNPLRLVRREDRRAAADGAAIPSRERFSATVTVVRK